MSSSAPGRKPAPDDRLLLPSLLRQLSFFSELGLNLSQFRCAANLSHNQRVVLLVLLPPLCLIVLPPCWWALQGALNWARGAAFACCKRRCAVREGAEPPAPVALPPSDVGVSALVLLLPVAITALSHAQDCERDELSAYLVSDPSVPCRLLGGVLEAAKWATRAYIGLPALIFVWCAWELPFFEKLDFLSTGYHQLSVPAMYYECATLLRKALVTALATRTIVFDPQSRDPRVNMVFTIQLLAFSLIFHQLVLPFGKGVRRNEALNWLEIQALVTCVAAALSILARMQSRMGLDFPMDTDDLNRMDVFAVFAALFFFARWAVLIVDATPLGAGKLGPALQAAALGATVLTIKCIGAVMRRARTLAMRGQATMDRPSYAAAATGTSFRVQTGPRQRPPGGGEEAGGAAAAANAKGGGATPLTTATQLWLSALAAAEERAAQRDLLVGSGALALREAREDELPHLEVEEEEGEPAAGVGLEFVVRNPIAGAAAERSAPEPPLLEAGGEEADSFSTSNPMRRQRNDAPPAPAPAEAPQKESAGFRPAFSRWKPQTKPLTAATPLRGAGAEDGGGGAAFSVTNPLAGRGGGKGALKTGDSKLRSVASSREPPELPRAVVGSGEVAHFVKNPKREEKKKRRSASKH